MLLCVRIGAAARPFDACGMAACDAAACNVSAAGDIGDVCCVCSKCDERMAGMGINVL